MLSLFQNLNHSKVCSEVGKEVEIKATMMDAMATMEKGTMEKGTMEKETMVLVAHAEEKINVKIVNQPIKLLFALLMVLVVVIKQRKVVIQIAVSKQNH